MECRFDQPTGPILRGETPVWCRHQGCCHGGRWSRPCGPADPSAKDRCRHDKVIRVNSQPCQVIARCDLRLIHGRNFCIIASSSASSRYPISKHRTTMSCNCPCVIQRGTAKCDAFYCVQVRFQCLSKRGGHLILSIFLTFVFFGRIITTIGYGTRTATHPGSSKKVKNGSATRGEHLWLHGLAYVQTLVTPRGRR